MVNDAGPLRSTEARPPDAVDMPRIVVGAPASGHGKTTVATGLLAALTARGLTVSPHKVGPDYIDPGYHALAAGRPGRNLDVHLVGEELIAPLFLHGALTPTPADAAVVEGVMGLFDGAGRDHGRGLDHASTAHVARLLDAPCAAGFARFDERVRVAGVVLNRVGSARHERLCRTALEDLGLPVLGALYRAAAVETPSRHLGLVPVAERAPESLAAVAARARRVEDQVDVDAVLATARAAAPLAAVPWSPEAALAPVGGPVDVRSAAGRGPRIAVAGGAAFTFSYAETAELLCAAGAEVVVVDPLRDARLPEGTHAVVIGGGFPEVHAEALAANTSLLSELASFTGPVVAECAGLLYLARSLQGRPMAGVVPAEGAMTPRLTMGYRRATALDDSVILRRGEQVHGHEFHRTALTPAPRGAWRFDPVEPGADPVLEGHADERVHASYLHLHWAGAPVLARRLVVAAAVHAASGVPA